MKRWIYSGEIRAVRAQACRWMMPGSGVEEIRWNLFFKALRGGGSRAPEPLRAETRVGPGVPLRAGSRPGPRKPAQRVVGGAGGPHRGRSTL